MKITFSGDDVRTVTLDGITVGSLVFDRDKGWVAHPAIAERSKHAMVRGQWDGFRANPLDATCWMLNWQGLPMGTADRLLHDWPLLASDHGAIEEFLSAMTEGAAA